jgi:PII-like signaling protein
MSEPASATRGVLLQLYVHENRRHGHVLLYEWLLDEARRLGIPGGSAFRAIASYGRHGVLHEEHFFELAGDLTVRVDFAVTDVQAQALLAHIEREGIDLFHVTTAATFAGTGAARA